jgi:tRNA(Arg) A34 adenosine deaminase TadA
MDYIRKAVNLSKTSFETGAFPAGAVLVTRSGNVYESKPSVPYNHGETMVIDMAIEAEGAPLTGATMYGSMQPCLMCTSKMYWAGIESAQYVIPKTAVNAAYAYESTADTAEIATHFFEPISMLHVPEHQEEALGIYFDWVTKIEGTS